MQVSENRRCEDGQISNTPVSSLERFAPVKYSGSPAAGQSAMQGTLQDLDACDYGNGGNCDLYAMQGALQVPGPEVKEDGECAADVSGKEVLGGMSYEGPCPGSFVLPGSRPTDCPLEGSYNHSNDDDDGQLAGLKGETCRNFLTPRPRAGASGDLRQQDEQVLATRFEGIVAGSYVLPATVPTVLEDDNLAIHTYVQGAVSGDPAEVCEGSSGCDDGTSAVDTLAVKQRSGEGDVVTPRPFCCSSAADRYIMYEYDSDGASEDSHATLEDVYRLQVPEVALTMVLATCLHSRLAAVIRLHLKLRSQMRQFSRTPIQLYI